MGGVHVEVPGARRLQRGSREIRPAVEALLEDRRCRDDLDPVVRRDGEHLVAAGEGRQTGRDLLEPAGPLLVALRIVLFDFVEDAACRGGALGFRRPGEREAAELRHAPGRGREAGTLFRDDSGGALIDRPDRLLDAQNVPDAPRVFLGAGREAVGPELRLERHPVSGLRLDEGRGQEGSKLGEGSPGGRALGAQSGDEGRREVRTPRALAGERGQLVAEEFLARRRGVEPFADDHPRIGRIARGDPLPKILPGRLQVGRNRPHALDHPVPVLPRSEPSAPEVAHREHVPVHSPEGFAHVGVEEAPPDLPVALLAEQEIDLRKHHLAVDPLCRRERSRRKRGHLRPKGFQAPGLRVERGLGPVPQLSIDPGERRIHGRTAEISRDDGVA